MNRSLITREFEKLSLFWCLHDSIICYKSLPLISENFVWFVRGLKVRVYLSPLWTIWRKPFFDYFILWPSRIFFNLFIWLSNRWCEFLIYWKHYDKHHGLVLRLLSREQPFQNYFWLSFLGCLFCSDKIISVL